MRLTILVIALVAIAVLLMSVRVLLVKGGRFRRGHSCQYDPEAHINRKNHKQ